MYVLGAICIHILYKNFFSPIELKFRRSLACCSVASLLIYGFRNSLLLPSTEKIVFSLLVG